jgi:hypothetical protein
MTYIESNIKGLIEDYSMIKIHKKYLYGLEENDFKSGFGDLVKTFKTLYSSMRENPIIYAMKDEDDVKGFVKNMNFLLLLAHKSFINNNFTLSVKGNELALALKDAKITKPEIYFDIIHKIGFTTIGLSKKLSDSEDIIVEFPDNNRLIVALKAMADSICGFSTINSNQGSTYFKNLDYRVLENETPTEPKLTMEYIIYSLKDNRKEVVSILNSFISKYAKHSIKGDTYYNWTATYTYLANKKVIISIKSSVENCSIKLNLHHLGQYVDYLHEIPEKMVEEIKTNGWDCGSCNEKCEGGIKFEIDGATYKKCRCGSFVFNNPTVDTVKYGIKLLEMEMSYI